MDAATYKNERQKRGTLKGVAALLGVHWTTIARRESGVIEFGHEAVLALQSLPLRSPKEPRKRRPNDKVSGQTGG
jgi:hypothetical protein